LLLMMITAAGEEGATLSHLWNPSMKHMKTRTPMMRLIENTDYYETTIIRRSF